MNQNSKTNYFVWKTTDCLTCNGEGWSDNQDDLCPECDGLGKYLQSVPLQQALKEMAASGELRALLVEAGANCHSALVPVKVR